MRDFCYVERLQTSCKIRVSLKHHLRKKLASVKALVK